jgi:hypothetical protein
MRKPYRIILLLILSLVSVGASALGRLQDYADRGGQLALRNLTGETIYVQRSCPGATATVYDGTAGSTLATLYSDAGLTAKSNPFTVSSTGFFDFFTNSTTVRITFSGCSMTWTRTYLVTPSNSSISYNVVDYGADPTGIALSTTAFVNAIAAAGTKQIYVPEGTFLVDGVDGTNHIGFTLTGGMRCASAQLTTIKLKNSSTFDNADNNYLFTASTGAVIEGCTIDGNKANNADKRASGIFVGGSTSNVTIRDMVIKDFATYDIGFAVFAGDGIYIASTGSNVRVESTDLTGNERGGIIVAALTNLTLDGILSDGNGTFGADIEPNNSSNVLKQVTISNSRFVNTASAQVSIYGTGLNIVGYPGGTNNIEGVTVVNTIITNNRSYGLRMESITGGHVVNTRSFNNSKQGAGLWPNFYIGDYAKQLMVTGSAFAKSGVDSPSYSIDVTNTANVSDIILQGTFFSTVNDPGKKLTARLGAVVSNVVFGSATWDPPAMAVIGTAGSSVSTDVTVTGLVQSDPCFASLSSISTTTTISCYGISSNTARITLLNVQNAILDLASGTVRVYGFKP